MYSMKNLTPRRTAILTFIRDRIAQQGQSPSLAEIAEAFGFASRSVARKHVLALTEGGFIEVNPNQARGIRLLNQP
ncbi:LexA family protein, partial [Pseudomonas sp. K5002]|nr:repressor LexA [Pseudomonas sp. K5002]